MSNFSLAAAGSAGLGFGAGLGARSGAFFAGNRRREPHLGGLAAIGLLQRDLHVVAEVGATFAAVAATAPTAAHAEQIVENVREGGRKIGAETGASAAALLERRVAEAIIGGPFVAVL